MRQLRIVGICTFAVLAFGVAGVSAAQVAEVGECLKTAKNAERHFTGHYIDKACTAPATKLQEQEGKANKYEWSPGVAPANAKFTGKGKAAEFVGAAGTFVCTKSAIAGEWTGPKTDTEVITYRGCAFKGAVYPGDCTTAGQPMFTIVTNTLDTTLLDHGEHGPSGGEPAEGRVWDALASAEPSGVIADFVCDSLVEIRESGSVSGVFTPESLNTMTKKAALEFNGILGEEPGKFGEQDLHSEASIGGGPFEPAGQGILKTTFSLKFSGKIEIRP